MSYAAVTSLVQEVLQPDGRLTTASVTSLVQEVLQPDPPTSTARVTSVVQEVLQPDQSIATSSVLYAIVIGGRVTQLVFGPLPTSTTTTLYVDVTGFAPPPVVGDYYNDVCNTFTSAPPAAPTGSLPPTTGNPSNPGGGGSGGGGGGGGTTNPGPASPATLVQVYVPFHAHGSATFSATVPTVLTEVSASLRTWFDFSNVCEVRLQGVITASLANAELVACYSTDGGATWALLSRLGFGPTLALSSTGAKKGPRYNVAPNAQTDVLVSLFARYGGGGSVTLGNVGLMCYHKANAGSCATIPETATPPFSTLRVTSVIGEVWTRL